MLFRVALCRPPNSGKEINCCFVIDPSADFSFVGRVQCPDLVLDPSDIDGHPRIHNNEYYYHDI